MAEARKAILVRLNPALAEQVARLASRELRSVNAQIEFLLRESLQRRGLSLADDQAGASGAVDGGEAAAPGGAGA